MLCVKLKLKMLLKTSTKIKTYMTSVITQKPKNISRNANNLVVRKMKDETCGVSIKGFAELKYKMYTFITDKIHESKKAKDINKNVLDD